MDKAWYVVWCRTGAEQDTLQRLQSLPGVDRTLMPQETLRVRKAGEWGYKEVILFPGYIFLECCMTSTIYYAIKGMPQVLGWLGKDTYWPCAVPRAEMDTLIGVTAAMEAGTNPREWLKNVDIRTRQRRGYGTLTIQGKGYTVPFNLEDKQPEDPQGDASPAEDKGE